MQAKAAKQIDPRRVAMAVAAGAVGMKGPPGKREARRKKEEEDLLPAPLLRAVPVPKEEVLELDLDLLREKSHLCVSPYRRLGRASIRITITRHSSTRRS